MTNNCSDIFNALLGEWTLNRTITPGGSFEGTAVFEARSDTVFEYREEGRFTLDDGTVLQPTKSYEWRLEDGNIVVYFNDGATKGQLFHVIDLTEGGQAAATHWCDPDQYNTDYSFADMPNGFSMTHKVEGPKKSYTSKSLFTRSL